MKSFTYSNQFINLKTIIYKGKAMNLQLKNMNKKWCQFSNIK